MKSEDLKVGTKIKAIDNYYGMIIYMQCDNAYPLRYSALMGVEIDSNRFG